MRALCAPSASTAARILEISSPSCASFASFWFAAPAPPLHTPVPVSPPSAASFASFSSFYSAFIFSCAALAYRPGQSKNF